MLLLAAGCYYVCLFSDLANQSEPKLPDLLLLLLFIVFVVGPGRAGPPDVDEAPVRLQGAGRESQAGGDGGTGGEQRAQGQA